jgi:hypothetical protein
MAFTCLSTTSRQVCATAGRKRHTSSSGTLSGRTTSGFRIAELQNSLDLTIVSVWDWQPALTSAFVWAQAESSGEQEWRRASCLAHGLPSAQPA